jgi:hypothetical protein
MGLGGCLPSHPPRLSRKLLSLLVQIVTVMAETPAARTGFPVVGFDVVAFCAFVIVVIHGFAGAS